MDAVAASASVDARATTRRTTAAATASTVLAVLPVFLLGSLIVLVRRDIAFSDTQLGLAISAFFLGSSLSAMPGGKLADRIGPRTGILAAAAATTTALIGIGTLAAEWWHVVGFMIFAGFAHGVSGPSANLALARFVPVVRQGMAFGVKQAANPVASVLAGFAVPLLGLTLGWRWPFVGGALVLGAVVVFLAGTALPRAHARSTSVAGRAPPGPMILLAVTAALASAAAATTIGFYVEAAVARGFDTGTVGYLFGAGSMVGIAARVFWGWLADRRARGHLLFLSGLFAAGSVGFSLLGVVDSVPLLAAATVLVFVAGWSWSGLMFLVAARGSPGAPAFATGVASAGGAFGGLVGPFVFGATVEQTSYAIAWFVVSLWMVAAAVAARATLGVWRRALRARAER